ncbi:MAG: TIR domain-containing protein [Hyphomicrobiaceae bacterium]
MTDVFISYASNDVAHAESLASQLEDLGFDVWWDRELAGEDLDKVIRQQIQDANCVVVIWTENSASSPWVRGEATMAQHQKKLIAAHPAGFDIIERPIQFLYLQSIELANIEKLERAINRFRPAAEDEDVEQDADGGEVPSIDEENDIDTLWEESKGDDPGPGIVASTKIIELYQDVEATEDIAAAYHNRAMHYEKHDDLDRAILDYTWAIDHDGNDADYYIMRAGAYLKKKKPIAATKDLSSALDLRSDARTLERRGDVYAERGYFNEAAIDYEQALSLAPNKKGLRSKLAKMRNKLHK